MDEIEVLVTVPVKVVVVRVHCNTEEQKEDREAVRVYRDSIADTQLFTFDLVQVEDAALVNCRRRDRRRRLRILCGFFILRLWFANCDLSLYAEDSWELGFGTTCGDTKGTIEGSGSRFLGLLFILGMTFRFPRAYPRVVVLKV